jgi:hypothetical protein
MNKVIEPHEVFVGLLCKWAIKPRGGYGYTVLVDAKVVQANLQGDKVVIEVEARNGNMLKRKVLTNSLRHVYNE